MAVSEQRTYSPTGLAPTPSKIHPKSGTHPRGFYVLTLAIARGIVCDVEHSTFEVDKIL